MSFKIDSLAGMLCTFLAAGLLQGQVVATQPATQAVSTVVPQAPVDAAITAVIKEIEQAGTSGLAAAAYARGCESNRNSVLLNRAYMLRMLQLGKPDIASYPAQLLVKSDKSNGLAWAVAGCNDGRQNHLTDALKEFIQAAVLLKDDPSIQADFGQLAAWNQSQPTSIRLSQSETAMLQSLLKDLTGQAVFDDAFALVKQAYDRRKEQAAAAEDRLSELQSEGQGLEAELRTVNDEIANGDPNSDDDDDGAAAAALLAQRDDLRNFQIPQAKRAFDGQKRVVDDFRSHMNLPPVSVGVHLRWELPTSVPAMPVVNEGAAPAAGPPPEAPETKAVEAIKQLELANAYMDNGLHDKGRVLLESVVIMYPDTAAASRAKGLLGNGK